MIPNSQSEAACPEAHSQQGHGTVLQAASSPCKENQRFNKLKLGLSKHKAQGELEYIVTQRGKAGMSELNEKGVEERGKGGTME